MKLYRIVAPKIETDEDDEDDEQNETRELKVNKKNQRQRSTFLRSFWCYSPKVPEQNPWTEPFAFHFDVYFLNFCFIAIANGGIDTG